MQFDISRAFPYPVLRPGVDDYVEGAIQTTIEFLYSVDEKTLTADITMVISVPELTELIAKGLAKYVVVVACRNTYFRQSISSTTPDFHHTFDAGMLRGDVLLYPYVVAISDISDFQCEWINEEFGVAPFTFAENSVLAVDQPQSIYIDREAFKPITSCFVLVQNAEVPPNEWRLQLMYDQINIVTNPLLKSQIDSARNSNKNKAILLNSIYFGAVVQAIIALKANDEHDTYRWAKIFTQRIHDCGLNIDTQDEVLIAQQLMKRPVQLLTTYWFQEDHID